MKLMIFTIIKKNRRLILQVLIFCLLKIMNLMLRLHRHFWRMKVLMLLLSVMVSRLSGNLQGVHHIHMM